MPVWGRAVPDNHSEPDKRKRAGFPDFILFHSQEHLAHAAVMEVKTWWSYKNDKLKKILSGLYLTNAPRPEHLAVPLARENAGYFIWNDPHPTTALIQQVRIKTAT